MCSFSSNLADPDVVDCRFDHVNLALTIFASISDWQPLKGLQNIALSLHQLGHWELALGYALAATRLMRFAHKALYWAAVVCNKLGEPAAALWFVIQVRACAPQ